MVQRKAPPKIDPQPEPKRQSTPSHHHHHQNQNQRGDLKKKMKLERSIRAADLESLQDSQMKKRSSPNYMKPTSSSDARKEQQQVIVHANTSTNKKRRNPRNSKNSNSDSLSLIKSTCSSTLKDSKFPKALDLNPWGTSVMRVCPYTYCSLNGHRHEALPPLKCFISARRKLIKTQKSMKLKRVSSLKEIDTGQKASIKVLPSLEEPDNFFVEIYTAGSEVSNEEVDVMVSSLEFVECDEEEKTPSLVEEDDEELEVECNVVGLLEKANEGAVESESEVSTFNINWEEEEGSPFTDNVTECSECPDGCCHILNDCDVAQADVEGREEAKQEVAEDDGNRSNCDELGREVDQSVIEMSDSMAPDGGNMDIVDSELTDDCSRLLNACDVVQADVEGREEAKQDVAEDDNNTSNCDGLEQEVDQRVIEMSDAMAPDNGDLDIIDSECTDDCSHLLNACDVVQADVDGREEVKQEVAEDDNNTSNELEQEVDQSVIEMSDAMAPDGGKLDIIDSECTDECSHLLNAWDIVQADVDGREEAKQEVAEDDNKKTSNCDECEHEVGIIDSESHKEEEVCRIEEPESLEDNDNTCYLCESNMNISNIRFTDFEDTVSEEEEEEEDGHALSETCNAETGIFEDDGLEEHNDFLKEQENTNGDDGCEERHALSETCNDETGIFEDDGLEEQNDFLKEQENKNEDDGCEDEHALSETCNVERGIFEDDGLEEQNDFLIEQENKNEDEDEAWESESEKQEEVNPTEGYTSESNAKIRVGRKKKISEESDETREFNPRPPRFLDVEPDPEAEKVDLRHQEMDERKNSEEYLIDHALQRAVTKLAPARNRKVQLLVEAFETVTPPPMLEKPLRRRHSTSGIIHGRYMQACS